MKKLLGGLILMLSMSMPAIADDCGIVIDKANVINTTKIGPAANELINAGAEIHYLAVDNLGSEPNMDILEQHLERSCPSWQGANGQRKNNIILFAVATKAHKTGVYYGSQFHKALDGHSLDIQNDMKPKFRDGDFTGGFVVGSETALSYLKAATVVGSGHTTIVNKQATDYSGLWTFLKWLLFLAILGSIGWVVYYFYNKRNEDREARLEAQRAARTKKNQAIDAVDRFIKRAKTDEDKQAAADAQSVLDRLTASALYDVEANLAVKDYNTIGQLYDQVISSCDRSWRFSSSKKNAPSHHSHVNTSSNGSPSKSYPQVTTPTTQTTQQTITNNTTYVDRGGYYDPYPVVIPVVVEEPVYREPYHQPDSTPSYSRSSSSDDSDSGSSSSWSSSDSSSSDSGSSSDFSSSDCGGGSSSDW